MSVGAFAVIIKHNAKFWGGVNMTRKEKRKAFQGIGVALLVILIGILILFRNELRTLMSLKKVDDY